jgi:hypothetical protein
MSTFVPASGSQDPLFRAGALRVSGSGVLRVDGADKLADFQDHLGITSVERGGRRRSLSRHSHLRSRF